jgi:hypothetical protein
MGTRGHVAGMVPRIIRQCPLMAWIGGFQIGPESLACGLAAHTGEPVLTTDVRNCGDGWRNASTIALLELSDSHRGGQIRRHAGDLLAGTARSDRTRSGAFAATYAIGVSIRMLDRENITQWGSGRGRAASNICPARRQGSMNGRVIFPLTSERKTLILLSKLERTQCQKQTSCRARSTY